METPPPSAAARVDDASPRVRIELASLRYASAFVAAARASKRLHKPWVAPPANLPAFREYLTAKQNPWHVSYVVIAEPSNALVGMINLNEIVRGLFQSAYVGYFGFAPHQGRGYMSLGLGAVIQAAFREHGLHRLEANIQPKNKASIELVQRAGFQREGYSRRFLKIAGRWCDHERYALLAEDWPRARRELQARHSHLASLPR